MSILWNIVWFFHCKDGKLKKKHRAVERKNMWYTKYEYIIKVAETKNISQAAKELFISQPALTKYINNIEQELGIKLFNRKTIPVTLTYAGERFVRKAEHIMEMQTSLEREMQELCEMKKGRLSIGVSASRGEYWLPLMLPMFKKKHPGIEIKLMENTYDYLEEYIEKEYIDIALITAPVQTDNVEKVVLSEEKILLAVSEKSKLLEGLDISENCLDDLIYIEPEKLNGEDMISLLPGLGMARYQKRIVQEYNVKPNTILETSNVDTAFCLACANMGVAFVPETCVVEKFPEWLPVLCTVERPAITRSSVAIYKKGRPLSSAAKAFLDIAKEVLHGDCPVFKKPTKEEYIRARKSMKEADTITAWLDRTI